MEKKMEAGQERMEKGEEEVKNQIQGLHGEIKEVQRKIEEVESEVRRKIVEVENKFHQRPLEDDCECSQLLCHAGPVARGISQETTGTVLERRAAVARQRQPHTGSVTLDLKWRFRWNVLEHSPNSPYLAPSDFHLFGLLKKHLEGHHFRTDAEVQEAVVKWLRDLDPDFFYAGFDTLVYRRQKCFNNHGDYMEK
ncbi:hypothetical protein AVEN_63438-1 [Araneus ventricosus]|uniref:Histone-lysine N-methyltransferase SETMAR n=1 Tax=Araneus ventricosus TaxID=182803 RepID=A0A4Y2MZM3_ARAVE|nr:hypothetical protein AVEN_63438-1 [Araneus ventricosus]